MLSPESSPVHQLVASWWQAKDWPRFHEIPDLRVKLTETALAELRLKSALNVRWEPFLDARLLWAAEWLQKAERRSYQIDPDIHARASWHFDSPFAPSGKDLAAGA